MPAIYIVTLLVLLGSDLLPSKVHAESNGSGEGYCRNALTKIEAITTEPRQACTCGLSSGTISRVDIVNPQSGIIIKSVQTCSGCTGAEFPITDSVDCEHVPEALRPQLVNYCQKVFPRCTNVKVYRCGCAAPTTTAGPGTPPLPTGTLPPIQPSTEQALMAPNRGVLGQ